MPPVFNGNIISVSPAEAQAGMPLSVDVAYKVETTHLLEKINGWWTRIEFDLSGGGVTFQQQAGMSFKYGGSVDKSLKVYLGTMPYSDITGTIKLLAYEGGLSPYFEVVDIWTIRIVSSSVSVPLPTPIKTPTPLPAPEPEPTPAPTPTSGSKGVPSWVWIAAAAGAAIILLPSGKKR